jgi:dolichol-phosphate mannosyltransferase
MHDAVRTLDVVIPLRDEEAVLPTLHARLRATLEGLPDARWRVVCVDDGSVDRTPEQLAAMHAEDPRFAVVALSRSFGHAAAIAAGLHHADADAVVVMDGDLQDPPEVIPALWEAWHAGAEVVRARRVGRSEVGPRRFALDVFHLLFRALRDDPVPTQTGVFGLFDRRALAALNTLPERHRFLPGMRWWVGFRQAEVPYTRAPRAAGAPRQSLRSLFRYAFDAIFGYSRVPTRGLWAGGASLLMSGVVGMGLSPAFEGRFLAAEGIALTGVVLLGLAPLGEYVLRVLEEVRGRPLYVVRARFGVAPPNGGG